MKRFFVVVLFKDFQFFMHRKFMFVVWLEENTSGHMNINPSKNISEGEKCEREISISRCCINYGYVNEKSFWKYIHVIQNFSSMFFPNRRSTLNNLKFLKSSKQFHRIHTNTFHIHLLKYM